jgi:vacuolar-type H+-ATPase catalytic subunit A/Vma1
MSAGDRALNAIKTIFTLKEQVDGLGRDIAAMNTRVSRLAEAHGELRDRVSRLEGIIEGAAMAARQRRIEE